MCAIVGALLNPHHHPGDRKLAEVVTRYILNASVARGRDGRGFYMQTGATARSFKSSSRSESWDLPQELFIDDSGSGEVLIANLRAEPTTEFVLNKRERDQQPYQTGDWTIVHNGTIANDEELRTYDVDTKIDSAAIVEQLHIAWSRRMADGEQLDRSVAAEVFREVIQSLKGSYAILATNIVFPDTIFAAANYRPIWFARTSYATFFASARDYFPDWLTPQMVPPYSIHIFRADTKVRLDDATAGEGRRALVVCSGGMDSTVAAAHAVHSGYEVELVHFQYGCRAEGVEVEAVKAVAGYYDIPVHFIPLGIYDPADSPLLRSDSTIAGGEAGAEFAHEWVPARNLVMLSIATAFAEAKGFDTIVLGNNLEEAGAYPDNEPEFISKFNDILPFAVGDGKRVRVIMPVGNMMKHEIVKLGYELDAPMALTWSCYRSGEQHCGTCGPCFMRRTAHEINRIPESITYMNEEK